MLSRGLLVAFLCLWALVQLIMEITSIHGYSGLDHLLEPQRNRDHPSCNSVKLTYLAYFLRQQNFRDKWKQENAWLHILNADASLVFSLISQGWFCIPIPVE